GGGSGRERARGPPRRWSARKAGARRCGLLPRLPTAWHAEHIRSARARPCLSRGVGLLSSAAPGEVASSTKTMASTVTWKVRLWAKLRNVNLLVAMSRHLLAGPVFSSSLSVAWIFPPRGHG